MAAWASGAWKSDAWLGTAWAQQTVSTIATVVQRGGSSKRKRRKWKTTEEILEDLLEEHQEPIKYVPAPEIKAAPLELNYDLIGSKIVEKIINQQIAIEVDRKKKRKKAISMMLLDS